MRGSSCRILHWLLKLLYGQLEVEPVGIVGHGRSFRAGSRRSAVPSRRYRAELGRPLGARRRRRRPDLGNVRGKVLMRAPHRFSGAQKTIIEVH